MRLPKHSNPNLAGDTTRIVSRRTLQLEDDAGDDLPQDGGVGEVNLEREVEVLYARLDKIVSGRLRLKSILQAPDELPNKRRKTFTEKGPNNTAALQQHSEPVGESDASSFLQQTTNQLLFEVFRLVSKSLPPRAIHISPKPSKVIR
jgi:hypothetical protein